MTPSDLLGDRIDAQVDEVAALALVIGGVVTAAVGLLSAAGILALAGTREAEYFRAPLAFALCGGVLGLSMRAIGRRRVVARWAGVLVLMLALLPTAFFVFAET